MPAPSSDLPSAVQARDTALRAGDRAAFQALFDDAWESAVAFAESLVRDPAEAEDLVQEAFVRLWDRRAALEADMPCRAYLFRTVRNLAFNRRRDRATQARLLDDPSAMDTAAAPRPAERPDSAVVAHETEGQLLTVLADLPPRQREAVLLSRYHGLSHAEVAAAMGCAPRTVNNHLVAALSTLRTRLTQAGALVAAFAWWIT